MIFKHELLPEFEYKRNKSEVRIQIVINKYNQVMVRLWETLIFDYITAAEQINVIGVSLVKKVKNS